MKGKMNILVLGGVLLLIAMFGASGYLLFRGISRFSSAERKANEQFRKLEAYYGKNPFPSEMNVDIQRENAEKLSAWSDSLLKELRKGNVVVAEKSPSHFMALAGSTRNKLLRTAEENGVKLSGQFAFGFDRYLGVDSALPPPEAVPDLTRQLIFVQDIVQIMVTNRVVSIDLVEREDIEVTSAKFGKPAHAAAPPAAAAAAAPAAGRRRRGGTSQAAKAPVVGVGGVQAAGQPEALYSTFSFSFDFRATERVLLAVLNELAGHRGFLTVTSVEWHRDGDDVSPAGDVQPTIVKVPPSPSLPQGEERKVWPSRQERIIAGPSHEQPMRVRLGIDVFRFKGDPSSGTDQ